jgi:hypothetical protein
MELGIFTLWNTKFKKDITDICSYFNDIVHSRQSLFYVEEAYLDPFGRSYIGTKFGTPKTLFPEM